MHILRARIKKLCKRLEKPNTTHRFLFPKTSSRFLLLPLIIITTANPLPHSSVATTKPLPQSIDVLPIPYSFVLSLTSRNIMPSLHIQSNLCFSLLQLHWRWTWRPDPRLSVVTVIAREPNTIHRVTVLQWTRWLQSFCILLYFRNNLVTICFHICLSPQIYFIYVHVPFLFCFNHGKFSWEQTKTTECER